MGDVDLFSSIVSRQYHGSKSVRETSGAPANDIVTMVLGSQKPGHSTPAPSSTSFAARMLAGNKNSYSVEETLLGEEDDDVAETFVSDDEDESDQPKSPSEESRDFEYDSYDNPLAIIAANTIQAVLDNLKERTYWTQLTHGSYNDMFPGHQERINKAVENLGKIIGVDHFVRAYLYPNTMIIPDRRGDMNLDGLSLVVTGDTPLQALSFVRWGAHRAYIMDCSSTEKSKTAHNFVGEQNTSYLASSKVDTSNLLRIHEQRQLPILAYDGRVSYGKVLNKGSLNTAIVVTNYSERVMHQIDVMLQRNPLMTIEDFFHSQAYVSAIAHGQAETVGVMYAAMNDVPKDLTMKTGMPYPCVKPIFIAPTHYIRRVSRASLDHRRIASNSSGKTDGSFYQIYINLFGDTDHMLPEYFSNSTGHNIPVVNRGFIVDNGIDHGLTVHSERSVTIPMWAATAYPADLDVMLSDRATSVRIQEIDSMAEVGSGLPTHGLFRDVSESSSQAVVPLVGSGLSSVHQTTRAYRFDDNNPTNDPIDVLYSTEMRGYYSAFHTHTQVSPSSVYIEGINPGKCSLETIVSMHSHSSKICIPLSNTHTAQQLLSLVLFVAQDACWTRKGAFSQEQGEVLGVKQVKFDGMQFTVDHSWLKQAYYKYKDRVSHATETRTGGHGMPHMRALSNAHRFLHHQEPANLALLISESLE